MRANRCIKAMSMVEAIVATLLICLTIFGVAALFKAGKRHSTLSGSNTVAGQMAYRFLAFLPGHIRDDTWDLSSNALREGTYYCDASGNPQIPGCPSLSERSINQLIYTGRYDIGELNGLRRVKLTIYWTENAP